MMTLSKEEIREIGKELKALLLPELVQELKTELIADLKSEIFADLVKDVKSQVLVEIKETYDKKNATIYKKIDSTKTSLSTKVNANETLVKDLATRVQSLEEKNLELEKDNSELHEMEKELGKSLLKINVLERRLEDRTNRSMRKTLVFKGIHEGEEEKTWQHTEDILAEVIANTLDVSTERASGMIERAHRSRPRSKTKGKRDIFAAIYDWKDSELIKESFQEACFNGENRGVYVEQMYGPDTSWRRRQALLERRNLINNKEIISGYITYPAKLFVKKQGQRGYSMYEDFSERPVPSIVPKERTPDENDANELD